MRANILAKNGIPSLSWMAPAAAGLGLAFIMTFAHSARADDVVFGFAGGMGGTSADIGNGVAVDASGNVYTTGAFVGTADFDPGGGVSNLTSAGAGDMFVSKLDSAGNFVWAKGMGGDVGRRIALDASGNVHTAGQFAGTADFDPGGDTVSLTSTSGSFDIFVSKLARTEYLVESWVDFGFVGSETGSQTKPFNTFAEGLLALVEPGTVKIKGNTGDSVSNETMTIDRVVTIEAVNGTVRIGDAGGRNSGAGPKSGFISRD